MAGTTVGTRSSGSILERARLMSAAMSAGLIAGALVGGAGGRIAMFILRLTSDPNLRGLKTDDDFTIGIVSAATMFLIVFCALAGALGGIVYLVVRSWVPPRSRPWLYGALAAVIGGASVIRPGGLDFRLLEPLSLAVVMFIALPGIYGVVTSLLAERFLERSTFFRGSARSLAGLAMLFPVALFGMAGLSILALVGVVLLLGLEGLHLAWIRSSRLMIWLGRAMLAAAGVVASIRARPRRGRGALSREPLRSRKVLDAERRVDTRPGPSGTVGPIERGSPAPAWSRPTTGRKQARGKGTSP